MKQVPKKYSSVVLIAISTFVLNVATEVLTKLLFSLKASPTDDPNTKFFTKPYLVTAIQYMSLLIAVVLNVFYEAITKTEIKDEVVNSIPYKTKHEEKMSRWKYYIFSAIPTLIGIISTGMQMVALVYLPLSIWCIWQAWSYIFYPVCQAMLQRKNSPGYKWFGGIITSLGLVIASFLFIFSAENFVRKLMSMGLMLVSIFFKALSVYLSHILLDGRRGLPTLRASLEGIWGTIFCGVVMIPVFNSKVALRIGIGENFYESLKMLARSVPVRVIFIILLVLTPIKKILGELLVERPSTKRKSFLACGEMILVWGLQILLSYTATNDLGDVLTIGSLIELAGLVIVIVGVFISDGVIRLPCFKYGDEAEKSTDSEESDDAKKEKPKDKVD